MRVASCLRGVAAAAAVVVGLVAIPATAQAATTKVPCDPVALKTAISNPNVDTLVLAERCVYSYTAADNPGNALPIITKKLTIIGNDATIQRVAPTNFRIFQIDPTGDLTLTDLTVRNGHAPGFGGGILLNGGGSTLKLNESMVTHNTADNNGGGIDNEGGAVTVNSSILSDNVSANTGGGMDMDGGTAAFDRSTVTDNTAMRFSGGGLWLSGLVTLTSTLVTNNTVNGAGGGIFNIGSLKIERGEVERNSATGTFGQGGGIYNGGTLTTNRLEIERNTASGTGGGLTNASTATLTRTEVERNTASNAPGGISNYRAGGVTLDRSEVEHNEPTNCFGSPQPVPTCVG